jgi:DNA-binding Xre family transcriptional regulator
MAEINNINLKVQKKNKQKLKERRGITLDNLVIPKQNKMESLKTNKLEFLYEKLSKLSIIEEKKQILNEDLIVN